ncbi:uncharacterized protein [Rutidosis leptorrhynchoides]|uniref:uncharacterized protein n=1 Tax=Rutidosis leptorrhynchoides TaxID=125765 RepID=UPI003A995F57
MEKLKEREKESNFCPLYSFEIDETPNENLEFPMVRSDPGEFHVPCKIRGPIPIVGLADTGSCINAMPFYVYNHLGLPSLEPIQEIVCFSDNLLQKPLGIIKDVEIQVGYAFYKVCFVVMDMEEDHITPLLMGSPFLTTARATIDYENNTLVIHYGALIVFIPIVPRARIPR